MQMETKNKIKYILHKQKNSALSYSLAKNVKLSSSLRYCFFCYSLAMQVLSLM